jgi:hypothetical protein
LESDEVEDMGFGVRKVFTDGMRESVAWHELSLAQSFGFKLRQRRSMTDNSAAATDRIINRPGQTIV